MPEAGLQRIREQVVVSDRLGQLDRAVAQRARLVRRVGEGERAPETRDRSYVVGVGGLAVDGRQRGPTAAPPSGAPGARAARRRPRRRWRRARGAEVTRSSPPARPAPARRAKSAPSRWLREAASSRLSRSSASSVSVLARSSERLSLSSCARLRSATPAAGRGSAPPCPRTRACARWRSGRPAAGRAGPTRGARGASSTCATRACSWARRDDASRPSTAWRASACGNRKDPPGPGAGSTSPAATAASSAPKVVSCVQSDAATSVFESKSSPMTAASSSTSRCAGCRAGPAGSRWCRGPTPAPGSRRAQRGQPTVGGQVAAQLAEEERVAAGLVTQHRRADPSPSGRDAALADEVVGDVVGVEPGEVEPPDAVEPVERGDRLGQRPGAVRRGGAVRAEQQDPGIGRLLHQVGQQLQRGVPAQWRSSSTRTSGRSAAAAAERVDRGVVQPAPVLGRAGAAVPGQRREPVGQGGGVLPGCAGEWEPAAQQVGHERLDRLHERLVRRSELLDAAAEQYGCPALVQHGGGLGQQSRLPSTGVTAHEDHLAGTGDGLRPDLVEDGQLPGAADEHRVRGAGPAHRHGWSGPTGHRAATLAAGPPTRR